MKTLLRTAATLAIAAASVSPALAHDANSRGSGFTTMNVPGFSYAHGNSTATTPARNDASGQPLWLVADMTGSGSPALTATPTATRGVAGATLAENIVSPVPEPAIALLLLVGLGVLGFVSRRRYSFSMAESAQP